jgi:bifunctional ADP-heptose synthase (sugar kinase/adenylyltransferase)
MIEKRILVIGDSCKDVFVYCNCERLCPEAPVPVLDIRQTVESDGMAGNVARNIASLKHPYDFITNPNKDLVTKTRYVEKKTNHMFIRIDSPVRIEQIDTEYLKSIDLQKYVAIVISDYNKGFLCERDIEYICESHPLTFIDTKKPLDCWAEKATFIKINRKEFKESELYIRQKLKDKVIQTLGCEGCEFQGVTYPVNEVEVKDLSGAGDSFLAALVVKFIERGEISEALKFANEAASIVVQKMGVSCINE